MCLACFRRLVSGETFATIGTLGTGYNVPSTGNFLKLKEPKSTKTFIFSFSEFRYMFNFGILCLFLYIWWHFSTSSSSTSLFPAFTDSLVESVSLRKKNQKTFDKLVYEKNGRNSATDSVRGGGSTDHFVSS